MVVSDWCIANRAHRWWVSIQGIVGIIGGGGGGWREGIFSSAIHCGSGRLPSCLIVGIHASGISNSTVPVNIVIVKSCASNLFNSARVPERVSANKLKLLPEWIMPGLTGVFRNG